MITQVNQMKKVLVPIDFSGSPNALINFAIGFEQQFKCKLLFFHSICELIPSSSVKTSYDDAVLEAIHSKEQKLIKIIAKSCQKFNISPSSLHSDYEIKLGGNVIDDILQVVEDEKIDFIIMSTHGSSGLKRFFLGSTTSVIISRAQIPVFIIPLNYTYKPIRQLTYACDLKDPVNELKQVGALAKKLNAEVEAVNFNYGISKADINLLDILKTSRVKFTEVKRNIELTLIDEMRLYMKRKSNNVLCMFTTPKMKLENLFRESKACGLVERLKFPLLSLPKYSDTSFIENKKTVSKKAG
ncbi:universal stress protein [Pedobacter sp. P351]|uniref:universal stress protein n=1 Tax=Pedobacter superstes TaxID=3133441 RepID=UPI0030A477E0